MKICSECKENKSLSDFSKDNKRKSGLRANCKSCANLNNKKWYSKNAEQQKIKCNENGKEYYKANTKKCLISARVIKLKKYWPNSTKEQAKQNYDNLLIQQNYKCKICKKTETAIDHRYGTLKSLSVDHCHKTGKVRGLLCTKCNYILGLLGDDINLANNCINYLNNLQ